MSPASEHTPSLRRHIALSLTAGTGTEWHDHGKSAGAFLTVSGALREQTPHGHRRIDRTLKAGEGRSFGPNHIHHVSNVGLHPALSLHLYAPRLTEMAQYAVTPGGLRARQIDGVGVNW